MNNFFEINIGSVITITIAFASLLVGIATLISTSVFRKKQSEPKIKAKIMDFEDLLTESSIYLENSYNMLVKKVFDNYGEFTDDYKQKSYFGNKGVTPNCNGFWMDDPITKDLAVIFSITSNTENRKIEPKGTIVEFKCEDIHIQELRIDKLIYVKSKKLKLEYKNIRYNQRGEEIEACYNNPFLNDSLYIVVFDVFDPLDRNSWLCNHNSDKQEFNILYESMKVYLTITSINNQKFHFVAEAKCIGDKVAFTSINKKSRIKKKIN